nr:HAD-IIIC family phosphatase [uncultured Acetatifactor sp.]
MLKHKTALLSNVNMDFTVRMLKKEVSVYEPEGYGNELGTLMNPESSYYAFGAETTFLILDLAELLGHEMEPSRAEALAGTWFHSFENAMKDETVYYISDAYLWCPEEAVFYDSGRKQALEHIWQKGLEALAERHGNVRILPYRRMIEKLGEENAFSRKMWYMGRIPLSVKAQERLCGLVLEKLRTEYGTPKKVLALDLDNTLWGGLAGEAEHTPVVLSDDRRGLAYKNLQRVILQMQRQGVLLAIISKNNEEDALHILENHPHMVLRPECFAAIRINWKPKNENLLEIAEELNLGTDSFVFWDDSVQERQLIKETIPQAAVPDFPENPELLAEAMGDIYRKYFDKPVLTGEDLQKTRQYAQNAKRSRLRETASSFDEFLKQLQIVLHREDPAENQERLGQLLNKTNQFNLTSNRFTPQQLSQMLKSNQKRIYLYRVTDRFGDNGLTAAAIADISRKTPVITDFVMSCRIMGRNIEYAIIEDIERDLKDQGFSSLQGIYAPTAKNKPVAELYDRLGYGLAAEEQGRLIYETTLPSRAKRVYYVKKEGMDT